MRNQYNISDVQPKNKMINAPFAVQTVAFSSTSK